MNNTGKLKPFVNTRSELRGIVANVIGATVGCFDNSSYYVCYAATVSDVDDNENKLRLNNRTRTMWVKTASFGVGMYGKTVSVSDPGSANDIIHGYSVFHEWMNSVSGKMFVCVSSTPNMAQWKLIQYVEL